ncbi:uncharacterized protein LOC143212765 isoform X1 [Lasioglossum baleicum]|uniref:uncharacterized protein LOC143212765 isoform X1 n=1 Tax=Lasioglossum baleicum TaxID=434251 RepID=UPI003FCC3D2A
MSSLDYLDLCRLCLVKDRVSVPIFEGEGNDLFLKIAACLPVKVAREDKLPKKICDDCVYKIELFYEFWNTTANAEKRLLQWLGEVSVEGGKQGYVSNVLNPNVMKQEQSTENRLDGGVMQQVGEHQNNMGMSMMDNMGLGIPMMMSNTNQQQQQITSVPMDTSGSSAQNVQAVPGPSSQATHNQISQNQTGSTQQEDEEESSEDEENSDDECDGDEGLPVKEESEEDPNSRTIEPTTFVNVSLACDEAGPSGLQQQKLTDMPEMSIPQPADGDPKTGMSTIADPRNPGQPLFVDCKGDSNIEYHAEESIDIKSPPISDEEVADDDDYLYAEEELEDEDQTDVDNESHIRITSCHSLVNEIHDDSLSSKVTTDVSSDSPMDTVKEDPPANRVPTVVVPVINPETKTIKNTVVPVDMIDDTGMNIIKSVLVPMPTHDGSACYEVKKVLVPIQPRPGLSVETPIRSAASLPVKMPIQSSSSSPAKVAIPPLSGLRAKVAIPPLSRMPAKIAIPPLSHLPAKIAIPKLSRSPAKIAIPKLSRSPAKMPIQPPPRYPVKMPIQPAPSFPVKIQIQPAPSLPVQAPPKFRMPQTEPLPVELPAKPTSNLPDNPTTNLSVTSSNKVRKILPKLMPIETVGEPCLEEAEDQLEEDPLKDKRIIGDDLDAMDKMLDDLRNTCPLCQLSFNTQQQMDRHFRRRHKNQFRCKKCHFSYDSPEALEDHKKIHDKDTYVECNLCHRKYKRISGLMAHRVRKHTTEDPRSLRDQVPEERVPNFNAADPDNTWGRRQVLGRSYSCERCNKVYPRKSFLIAHERIAHGIGIDDSKPLQCNICNKTFQNRKQYYKHDRSHSKMYLCSLCGKELKSEASLRLHNMRHNDERPFECSVCGKCFTAKVTLKVHELIHSGLRPYICDICGQSFTQRSSMMVHRKKHPGNHPPPPRVNLVNIQKR